jgi:hypothetical protein
MKTNTMFIGAFAAAALVTMSGLSHVSAAATLDRGALLKLADGYFAALLAHDPKKVPLADGFKVVENVKRLTPGEGLWKTTSSAPTAFKIVVADPVSQQIGGIVVLESDSKPSLVGFRLKVVDGKIAEAEHLVAATNNSPNLQTVRAPIPMEVPYEWADSRGRLIHIAKSYYDALDNNNGHLAPFASDCERHENGMRTAPNGGPSLAVALPPGAGPGAPGPGGAAPAGARPGGPGPGGPGRPAGLLGLQDCTTQIDSGTFQYITTIENRRVLIADETTGLAIGLSHFHHPMTQKVFQITGNPNREISDMSNQRAFDMPALHIFKIWGGQIHEIEAVGVMAPYNSPTGWE